MDEITSIVNAITNVGFPIVCCFYLFRLFQNVTTTMKELSDAIKSVEATLTSTLTGIEIRLQEIEYCSKLKGDDGK